MREPRACLGKLSIVLSLSWQTIIVHTGYKKGEARRFVSSISHLDIDAAEGHPDNRSAYIIHLVPAPVNISVKTAETSAIRVS